MGRPLPSSGLPMQALGFLPAPVTLFIVLASVFSVFAVVTFLCGSHTGMVKSLRGKTKTVRLGGENKKMKSRLSSKALLMISWRKAEDEEEDEEEVGEDGVVWKKTIIKGENCRPLEFSGKILYDSEGNLLPD